MVALGSGLLDSRTVLPVVGLASSRNRFLENVHAASAYTLVMMVGVHLGLQAHWIWSKLWRAPRSSADAGGKTPAGRRAAVVALLGLVLVLGFVAPGSALSANIVRA